jgi:hypothetical protein
MYIILLLEIDLRTEWVFFFSNVNWGMWSLPAMNTAVSKSNLMINLMSTYHNKSLYYISVVFRNIINTVNENYIFGWINWVC